MNRILLAIPFLYFFKTRLNSKTAILFFMYIECLAAFLILLYSGYPAFKLLSTILLNYLAFISLYEIGYIFNDTVSVKSETSPRKRLNAENKNTAVISVWILVRIISFLLITASLKMFNNANWWTFYAGLMIVFAFHNIIKKNTYRIFTFFSLAFFRFYSPIFFLVSTAFFLKTLPGVLIFYIFFRTITYMDSKGLLNIPDRKKLPFKVFYCLCFLPLSTAFSLFTNEWMILYFNLYCLFFWAMLLALNKMGIAKAE